MRNFNIIIFPFKLVILLCYIYHSLLIGIQKDIFNNIIIVENTNGDIYLSQNQDYDTLFFGTTLSNGEERIFYGLNSEKGYIIKKNDNYIPFIKKNIGRTEEKEIPNAEMGIISHFSDPDIFYIILIGNDDSYIEILNLSDYLNDFKMYSQSELFFRDTINKGKSSLIFTYYDSLLYVSSSTPRNDTSKYFISLHEFSFSYDSEAIELINNYDYNEIKGEYMSCFASQKNNFISCFYLDKDNNYKITFIQKNIDNIYIELNTTTIEINPKFEGNNFYFMKGVLENDNFGIYSFYIGESYDTPTLIFKYINDDLSIKDKYEKYPFVCLSGYTFNNGIKYNDLVANIESLSKNYADLFFISTSLDQEYLIIAYLIFYNTQLSNNENLLIRYSTIKIKEYFNMKIFHGFKAINYNVKVNNLLTIAFDFCIIDTCNILDDKKGNAAFIIFSYPNITE